MCFQFKYRLSKQVLVFIFMQNFRVFSNPRNFNFNYSFKNDMKFTLYRK